MKRIFITGAYGFVGANLARFFLNAGNTVIGLVRYEDSKHPNHLSGLSYREGRVEHPEPWCTIFESIDVVIHCAGPISFSTFGLGERQRNYVDSLTSLLTLARQFAVKQFLHIGACSVFGTSDKLTRVIDENGVANANNPYAKMKALADIECFRFADEGYDVRIASPSTVYGWGDSKLNSGALIQRLSNSQVALAPPGGTSFLTDEDLCSGVEAILTRGKAGQRFILTSGSLTYLELYRRISSVLANHPRLFVLPSIFKLPSVAIASVLDRVIPMMRPGIINLLSPAVIGEAFEFKSYSSKRAKELLNWTPTADLAGAVRRWVEYRQDHFK